MTIGRRLTLWYGAILAVSLVMLGAFVYVTFSRNLLGEIDRALDEELAEIALEVTAAPDAAAREAQLQKYFGQHEFYAIQVSRPDGEVIFSSHGVGDHPLSVPNLGDQPGTEVTEDVVMTDSVPYRMSSRVVTSFDGPMIIQAADSLSLYYRERRQLLAVMLGAAPVVLLTAAAGGVWLSRRALAPVDRMTRAAVEISASRLDRRVEADTDDELGRLATAFNAMIERLQKSFAEMQRFTADAAHELRTPLAVLRSEAEVALRAPRSGEEYRQVLRSQLEEIDRLTRLADQLLFLCREDAGEPSAPAAAVRVDALLQNVGDQLQASAKGKGLSLQVEQVPDCSVEIDADRLRRLFVNLLDNAIKYTPGGGQVRVTGRRDNGTVEITVQDTGPGITTEHLPHLFERFYRVDPARRRVDGTGLGLPICRSIVERQRGTIRVESDPGNGTTVCVALPVSDSDVA
jgi:heavy metal sensor kinase